MPRVSIVIPTYNHARFVGQTVNSALAQTYPDVEVIVVDDGSTDNTRAVLADYAGRIHYLYQTNRGLSAARNAGIAAARGDFFLFLDADDLIPPGKLEIQAPLLEARPDWGLVYSGFEFLSEDGARILGEVRPNKHGEVLKDLLRNTFYFPPGAAVVRRECIEHVGLFDEACPAAADTDLWVRIARAGYAFGYVDQPLFQYRLAAGSMSRNHRRQAQHELIRLDKFFADPDLPADLQALKAEAYSIVHYEFAAKFYSVGNVALGQEHLRQALALCPALASDREWLLEWLAGFASEPARPDPQRLLDTIFDNLPPEAATLRQLRRRAQGRYHAAAAFAAYRNGKLKEIRGHILPAVVADPALIRNRGFVSIALRSWLENSRKYV